MESLESESPEKTHFLSNQNRQLGILKFDKLSPAVSSPIQKRELNCAEKDCTDTNSKTISDSGGSTSVISHPVSNTKLINLDSGATQGEIAAQHKDQFDSGGLSKSVGVSLASLAQQHGRGIHGQGPSLASLARAGETLQHTEGSKGLSSLKSLAKADKVMSKGQVILMTKPREDCPASSVNVAGGFEARPNKPQGVSLSDLIKQSKLDGKTGEVSAGATQASKVLLADLAGQRSRSDIGGVTMGNTSAAVSLNDLAARMPRVTTTGNKQETTGPVQPPSKMGNSLAALANQHKSKTGLTDLTKVAVTESVIGQLSGLSLADLAKKHQSESKNTPVTVSLKDLASQQSSGTRTRSDVAKQHRTKDGKADTETSNSEIANVGKSPSAMLVSDQYSRVEETMLSDEFSESLRITDEFFSEGEITSSNNLKMVSPSVLAKTFALQMLRQMQPVSKKRLRFQRFSYQLQVRKVEKSSPKAKQNIVPFDFSTPSPDDMVKKKQTLAFTRSGR